MAIELTGNIAPKGTGFTKLVDSINIDFSNNPSDLLTGLTSLPDTSTDANGYEFAVVDSSGNQHKLLKTAINVSGFINDSNYSTTTGTVTSITAGTGFSFSEITGAGSIAVDGNLADLDAMGEVDVGDKFIVSTGAGAFAYENASSARSSLGLGDIATQNQAGVDIDGGNIDNTTIGATTATTGNFTVLNLSTGTDMIQSVSDQSITLFDNVGSGVDARTITIGGANCTVTVPNLHVTGTTTTVNSETINLSDNVITLNSNWADDTAPSQDGGITVYRGSGTGSQPAQSFFWDEDVDQWGIGHTEASEVFTATGHLTIVTHNTSVDANPGAGIDAAGIGSIQINDTDGTPGIWIRTA